MLDVDFDRVLSILHGWLGHEVRVGVSATARAVQVASIRGRLGAAADMQGPYDDDEWEFTVGGHGGFGMHRDYFAGADVFPDSGHLIVLLLNDPECPEDRAIMEIHIGGPWLEDPETRACGASGTDQQ
jgi:hypothetical protein